MAVSDAQRNLRETETKIATQHHELEQLNIQRQALENALLKRRAELAALLRSAYALGTQAQLKLLLEQDKISDFARALAYHRYFQNDRRQHIDHLHEQLNALQQLDVQAKTMQNALVLTREQQKQALTTLAAKRQERERVVSALQVRARSHRVQLTALERDEKKTLVLLERLQKLMQMQKVEKPISKSPERPSKSSQKTSKAQNTAIPTGPLRLPVSGSILAGYGGVMPDGNRSQGLLIASVAGAQVHATGAGRVAYSEWLKGYGLLIIIDHGKGWMSLYAFNDALLKNTGDSVRVGDVISTVGSSGGQGRPALYFELRHNGQPQDPQLWLKK